jgi:uncharacterized membrane protein YdbT with pleckstrin-like domain
MAKSYLESMLGERERILFVARQHWFILTSAIFLELTAILVTLAATVSLAIFLPVYALLIVAIGFAVLLLPIATMTRDILDWANRQFIVTNRRVIQIAGVINKNVTDSSLEKVNDVKMTQSVFGRTFGFGDIEILTASELGVNIFQRISDPVRFKTAMLNAKEQLEHGDLEAFSSEDIPALIARLDRLRQQSIISEDEFQSKKTELLNRL